MWQGSKTGQKQAILCFHLLAKFHDAGDLTISPRPKKKGTRQWLTCTCSSIRHCMFLTTCRSQWLQATTVISEFFGSEMWYNTNLEFLTRLTCSKSYEETGSLPRPLMLLIGFRSSWTFCEWPSSGTLWLSVIKISPEEAYKIGAGIICARREKWGHNGTELASFVASC